MTKDWADYPEALDAFWSDEPDLSRMSVEDRELWHQFARSAERRTLNEAVYEQRQERTVDLFPRPVVVR